MLKKLLLFLVGVGISVANCAGQTVVIQNNDATSGARGSGYSAYGYPHFALAGTDSQAYVSVFAEVDKITAWSGDGKNVTFTADNHLSAGDVVDIWKLSDNAGGWKWGLFLVTAATPTTFSIADRTKGEGIETSGEVRKRTGAGFTSNGTWTITNTGTDKSETYKLYTQDGSSSTDLSTNPTLTDVPHYINFVVGPKAGDCHASGLLPSSNKQIHSSIEFELRFTSAQDPSKTYAYHYVVCANGGGHPYQGVAHAVPGYRQVFRDRYIPLAGQVFGNTNQMMDWTITSAPPGGDATLSYATYPQPVFYSGKVAGKYRIKACPAVDHSEGACDNIAIYVSPDSPPAANTDKVEQVPCDIDPTVKWATVMHIGPSQKNKDLLSIPSSFAGPAIFLVHNEGPPGSPTEYHNQVQVNKPTSGKWNESNPSVVLCGVPNPTTGELPIVDGENATSNKWVSSYIVGYYGLISFLNPLGGGTPNDGKLKPFHHVLVSGLHMRHSLKGVHHYYDQNGALKPSGNYGLRPFGVQYWSVIGNFAENVGTPFFDDCNTQQSQWPACTLDTFYEGNHGRGYGNKGTSTEHMFYLQAFRDTTMLNLQEGTTPGSQGTQCFSDRGTRSFHMYNRCVPMPGYESASGTGGHSEIQDAYNYILPDEYFGYQGAKNCNTRYSGSPDCQGTFGGANWFAALTEEHNNSDFVIGSAFLYTGTGGVKFFGLETTHNTTGIDNSSKGFYAYNNVAIDQAALARTAPSFVEDTRLGTRGDLTEAYIPAVWPRSWVQNNIIAWKSNTNCAYNCAVFGTKAHLMMSFGTNMVAPGQVTVASKITPQYGTAAGIYRNGVSQFPNFFEYGNITPIEKHLGGWKQSNFVTYSKLPYDQTTMLPVARSEAIGKAAPLTGELALYPPRFNAVDADMSPFTLRKDLSTLGPYDPPGVPTSTTGTMK